MSGIVLWNVFSWFHNIRYSAVDAQKRCDANKTRILIGPCLREKYVDRAPCLCPWEGCSSIQLTENFSKRPCNMSVKTFEIQEVDNSSMQLFHSSMDFALGRIGNKCTLTYKVAVRDEVGAFEFCDAQHAFVLVRATRTASNTICEIHTVYDCSNTEQTIGDMCFSMSAASTISKGKKLCEAVNRNELSALHKVTSTAQQRWISAYFSNYGIIWIANGPNDIEYLLHDNLDGKRKLLNKYGRVVTGKSENYAMITRKGSLARLRVGTIAPMDPNTAIPVLCSRRATPRQELTSTLVERYKLVNIHSVTYKAKNGLFQPFTVVKGAFPYSGISKDLYYIGGGETHYKLCEGFKHGSAATTLDFDNVEDFKKLLRDADVNVVAVPGRLKRHAQRVTNSDCSKRDSDYKKKRSNWEYQRKNVAGKYYYEDVTDKGWKDRHPDNACADSPRVALVFSKDGLIDVPAFARHSVACTFGVLEKFGCAVNAHVKNGRCQCIDPAEELERHVNSFVFLSSDKELLKNKEQTLCFQCTANTEYAVVAITDASTPPFEVSFGSAYKHVLYAYRFAFAYMKVPIRVIHVGDGGIRFDTKKFHVASFNKDLSSDTLGQSKDWLTKGSGKLALAAAFKEAIEALKYHPYARKAIFLNVFGKGDTTAVDHEEAIKVAQQAGEYGIDVVVNHYYKGEFEATKFYPFATTKKVFAYDWSNWGEHSKGVTRALHFMYRKICLRIAALAVHLRTLPRLDVNISNRCFVSNGIPAIPVINLYMAMLNPLDKEANKTRILIGPCLREKYVDRAPCLCPWEGCSSIQLTENFSKRPCNMSVKTFEVQEVDNSSMQLFHSSMDFPLGRIVSCG
ncbi:hypothetical protein Q1695_004718 [Nippostrongylus brasiliensis]|nr:hypothetical protein Q1695_004718 [Nippostrongylus brasiliensis]